MSNFTNEELEKIWQKGTPVRGKDPDLYRKDIFGNLMFRHSYGLNSEMGWQVDHSKPQSKGGTDHLNNLQPMNSQANREKGNKY